MSIMPGVEVATVIRHARRVCPFTCARLQELALAKSRTIRTDDTIGWSSSSVEDTEMPPEWSERLSWRLPAGLLRSDVLPLFSHRALHE